MVPSSGSTCQRHLLPDFQQKLLDKHPHSTGALSPLLSPGPKGGASHQPPANVHPERSITDEPRLDMTLKESGITSGLKTECSISLWPSLTPPVVACLSSIPSSIPCRKKCNCTSKFWAFLKALKTLGAVYNRCQNCDTKFSVTTSTGLLQKHLKAFAHGVFHVETDEGPQARLDPDGMELFSDLWSIQKKVESLVLSYEFVSVLSQATAILRTWEVLFPVTSQCSQ